MFCYFKYSNEINKVSRYIRDENKGLWPTRPKGLDYINYETAQAPRDQRSHESILDLIFENEDLNLAEIMRPKVSRRFAPSISFS